HLNTAHTVANSDDLGQALVADRVSGRHWQPTLANADIQITTGHHQRPNQRLFGCGDLRVGYLVPGVSSSIFESQLPHLSILERSLKYCQDHATTRPQPRSTGRE